MKILWCTMRGRCEKAGISLLSTIEGAASQPCTTDDDDFDNSIFLVVTFALLVTLIIK